MTRWVGAARPPAPPPAPPAWRRVSWPSSTTSTARRPPPRPHHRHDSTTTATPTTRLTRPGALPLRACPSTPPAAFSCRPATPCGPGGTCTSTASPPAPPTHGGTASTRPSPPPRPQTPGDTASMTPPPLPPRSARTTFSCGTRPSSGTGGGTAASTTTRRLSPPTTAPPTITFTRRSCTTRPPPLALPSPCRRPSRPGRHTSLGVPALDSLRRRHSRCRGSNSPKSSSLRPARAARRLKYKLPHRSNSSGRRGCRDPRRRHHWTHSSCRHHLHHPHPHRLLPRVDPSPRRRPNPRSH